MPKGYAKNGINNGWFKKEQHPSPKTEFKKGNIPWNLNNGDYMKGENNHFFGKHHTEETKQINSEKHLGNKHSNKTRKQMSDSKTGHLTSKETRKKIGNANRGEKNGMFGKENKWGYHTEESIIKIKEKRKLQILPSKDTTIEIKIQNFLKQLNIEFFTHQYMKIEHGYQCDILIPSLNLVIECDGDYWHKYPVGLERDRIRTKELIEKGFKVLRLWEREIKIMTINNFKEKLKC